MGAPKWAIDLKLRAKMHGVDLKDVSARAGYCKHYLYQINCGNAPKGEWVPKRMNDALDTIIADRSKGGE